MADWLPNLPSDKTPNSPTIICKYILLFLIDIAITAVVFEVIITLTTYVCRLLPPVAIIGFPNFRQILHMLYIFIRILDTFLN